MKKDIRQLIREKRIFFDGGMGTMLQEMGLAAGEAPEAELFAHPERVAAIHRAYIEAGCSIVKTNTFGVNRAKYANYRELIRAGVEVAVGACDGREDLYVAFDIGPTGRLLEPLGDLPFEEAVAIFADNVKAAAEYGADMILIETMNDSYETKAALLAAKENCDLPVFVTNAYDRTGRLMTGATPSAVIALLEGMGADAIGLNCSFGPDGMLPIVEEYAKNASVPIIVNPNAGLPEVRDGATVYSLGADDFAASMRRIAEAGGCILGGCCGTTPEHIGAAVAAVRGVPYTLPLPKTATVVSSYAGSVTIGENPTLIGERINPTGKKRLKEALRTNEFDYILGEAVKQEESGAHILDVNVGLPDVDETSLMPRVVAEVQAVTPLPLQIDSASPEALAAAMRIYNGKPMVNSVNGDREKMNAVFPLVKKYGGVVVALTMDETGIPESADGRVEMALRIAEEAAKYGISKRDIVFDPLTLSVSADAHSADVTLEAVRRLHNLGYNTVLGVSNVSFGLPAREKINSTFFAAALEAGLSAAIMNPFSQPMTDVYHAFCVLHGLDPACERFIEYANAHPSITATANSQSSTPAAEKDGAPSSSALAYSIIKGIKEDAVKNADELLAAVDPLEVINAHIVPALNAVGADFEAGRAFLPQLLMSAESASAAFERVKLKLPASDRSDAHRVILATVKGDIHDIGKNIVRVLLESYGFNVIDLGRDVPPETVLDAAHEYSCSLVGLSALMTTTVPSMEATIRLLHGSDPAIRVVVGGAVLTQEYADMIGADHYAPDAMDTVRYAERFYRINN